MEAINKICEFYHTTPAEVRDVSMKLRGRGNIRKARQVLCWYYRSKGLSLDEVQLLTNLPRKTVGAYERYTRSLIIDKDIITLKLIEKL